MSLNLSETPSPTFIFMDEVDSTNEEAKRLASSGEKTACWIVADRQTAGRGRRGRAWDSPSGNLMTTLLLPGPFKADRAAQLSFVSGLALLELVKQVLPDDVHSKLRLKWPNDVLIDGQKVSGILLEAASIENGEISELVIGMGVNLTQHPSDTPYPATHIGAWTLNPPTNVFAAKVLADAFTRLYDDWRLNGFEPTRANWLRHAKGLYENIEVRLETHTLKGIFEGIDSDGQLSLRLEDGSLHYVAAGDVFFPHMDGASGS